MSEVKDNCTVTDMIARSMGAIAEICPLDEKAREDVDTIMLAWEKVSAARILGGDTVTTIIYRGSEFCMVNTDSTMVSRLMRFISTFHHMCVNAFSDECYKKISETLDTLSKKSNLLLFQPVPRGLLLHEFIRTHDVIISDKFVTQFVLSSWLMYHADVVNDVVSIMMSANEDISILRGLMGYDGDVVLRCCLLFTGVSEVQRCACMLTIASDARELPMDALYDALTRIPTASIKHIIGDTDARVDARLNILTRIMDKNDARYAMTDIVSILKEAYEKDVLCEVIGDAMLRSSVLEGESDVYNINKAMREDVLCEEVTSREEACRVLLLYIMSKME